MIDSETGIGVLSTTNRSALDLTGTNADWCARMAEPVTGIPSRIGELPLAFSRCAIADGAPVPGRRTSTGFRLRILQVLGAGVRPLVTGAVPFETGWITRRLDQHHRCRHLA